MDRSRQRTSCLVDSAKFFLFTEEEAEIEPPERAFEEGLIRDEPPNVVVRFADGAERKLLAKFVTPVSE